MLLALDGVGVGVRDLDVGGDVLAGGLAEGGDALEEGCLVVAPLDGGRDVGWGGEVGVAKHGDDAEQDGVDALGRPPPLLGQLSAHGVHAGGVEDRYTHWAVRVHVGVPEFAHEGQRRRAHREVRRELHLQLEHPSSVRGLCRAFHVDIPREHVRLIGDAG